MNWSRNQSIVLSKVCIGVSLLILLVGAVSLPQMVEGIVIRRGMELAAGRRYFYSSYYSLLIPAVTALVFLYRLLANISREEIFVKSNVQYLRWISWACFLAALISLLSACYYIPFLMLAGGAGFMGLILRVVKNVFAEAVYIKEENDFTI
ncbi:MAG: DUF2975 domain-containing protein [Lachnospiraceae bacterium]